MAWSSAGSLGSNQDKASATSIILTTSAVAEVGKVILVAIGADNIGTTDGDLNEISSVVDSAGNTYTKLKEQTNGQGAAEAGVTVSLWQTKVTTQLASGGTITATFAAAVLAKSISAWSFTVTAGATITLEGSDADVHDGAQPASMTISGLASQEYLWFVADCEENVNTGTYTPDADYTAIDKNGTTGGGGTTNVYIAGAFRIFTGTGDTYGASTNANRDGAQVYVALKEAAGGGTTKTVTDTGSGNEAAPAPLAGVPLTDLGSAVDLLSSLLASVPVTDSGSGADAVSLLTALLKTVTDLAAGQDNDPDIRVTFSLVDTGVGSEDPSTPTVQARFTVTDLALGADGPSVGVALTITDLGSADDLLNLITATLITITEIAQGTDLIGTITVSVSVPDLGSAADSLQQLLVDLALSDLGAGVEVVSAFNSATRLVDITFSLTARSISFDLSTRSIDLSLQQRSIDIELS